jgi:hypothetical protein
MKRILTFCVVLGFVFSGVRAQDASSLQNVVAIYPVQGERVLFSFASNPELSYTATELVITTAGTSVQYPINQLRSVKFEKAETAEGIDEIEVPEHFLFRGGPVGLNTIATAMGEDAGTIEDVYEPYLIKEGFIKRTPRGREATELAYKHLGKTPISADGQQSIF